MSPEQRKSTARQWIESLLSVVVFVWLFTNHVAQATEVPTESMVPAILPGDHFFLDRVGFESSVPDWLRPVLPSRVIKRGDILAFWSPEDGATRLVKRVIGLPGETIEIRDRAVWIDGRRLEERYTIFTVPETLPGPARRDHLPPVRIPDGHFFMMGDNRDNSYDSRFWGLAPRSSIIGRPTFVYWSYAMDAYEPPASVWDSVRQTSVRLVHVFDRTRWLRTGTMIR